MSPDENDAVYLYGPPAGAVPPADAADSAPDADPGDTGFVVDAATRKKLAEIARFGPYDWMVRSEMGAFYPHYVMEVSPAMEAALERYAVLERCTVMNIIIYALKTGLGYTMQGLYNMYDREG